ncbi:hypothetical protein [Ferrimonas senticii]|uniref:hypothetical protein n=1 Tax=Ferrimonas senticii TaxID=394566 RepID=UPI000412E9D1|nr:hypothetical protein [Ferrimonas senticii]
MSLDVAAEIERRLGDERPQKLAVVQRLWSGYGSIERWRLSCGRTIIAKLVAPPRQSEHPRGWDSDFAHQRKLRSYQVELSCYQWLKQQSTRTRTAEVLAIASTADRTQHLLLLEDLRCSGFDCNVEHPTEQQLQQALAWLACWHAQFIGVTVTGLWPQGSYWHLATRPDEHARMSNLPLKHAASQLDRQLRQARHQTLLHGDAKIANFGFADSEAVAYDFQYVGSGIGVIDVAYLLGSALTDGELLSDSDRWLDYYFAQFAKRCRLRAVDSSPIEREWRQLYDVAVADFARFLDGWAPQHWKVNLAMQRACDRVLARL